MLAGVTEHLSQNFDTVSLICRSENKINSKLKNVNPLILDYTYYKLLSKNIQSSVEKFENVDLVVSWIHSSAPSAPFSIAEKLNSYNTSFRFFDILGSAYADPSQNNNGREIKLTENKNLAYRRIILGFKIEYNTSRWLTNEEISSGVIEAIKTDSKETLIGTVTPWALRP